MSDFIIGAPLTLYVCIRCRFRSDLQFGLSNKINKMGYGSNISPKKIFTLELPNNLIELAKKIRG